jgi:hypothetical protein
MNNGHAQAAGAPQALAGHYLADPVVLLDAENRDALSALELEEGVVSVSWNGSVQVTLDDLNRLPDLVTRLVNGGARITRVEPMGATLEELYFEMQRAHREETP